MGQSLKVACNVRAKGTMIITYTGELVEGKIGLKIHIVLYHWYASTEAAETVHLLLPLHIFSPT